MPNRLARASSPYLRQHAGNPVDWYPWGDEAFERARREDKPVLLSIGYASCHWCHVMAHESFEDEAVARTMNERFVNVKVDREERPDVDAVYMNAVQAMTGGGGWPLTVVLTPAGEPFFGGTYFPPADRWGQPAFGRVLEAVSQAWRERREEVAEAAGHIGERLRVLEAPFPAGVAGPAGAAGPDAESLRASALSALTAAFDEGHGGFGGAPKFPPHGALRLLLEWPEARQAAMATATLRAMADGGIHDQLAGGFARYSVDAEWHVPHFEKMLYDNAQLLGSYAAAHARTGDARFRDVALGIVAWLKREMTSPDGGLYSSLDADSAGGEGRFYTWSEAEVDAAAGEDAELVKRVYGVRTPGAFEGRTVLRRVEPPADAASALGIDPEQADERLARARRALLAARERRPRPALDDKVLTSWNGLALQGLADAARLLPSADALALAEGVAAFARAELWRDGELVHVFRAGTTHVRGLLEDYAYLGLGLLALHRVTLAPEPLAWALELADVVRRDFADEAGGFYSTSVHAERLLVRPRALSDAATPSDNGAAGELLARLGRVTGDLELTGAAARAVRPLDAVMARHPQAFASALQVRTLLERAPREVVIVGAPESEDTAALTAVWRRCGDASIDALLVRGQDDPLLERAPLARGREPLDGRATAYVCRAGVCRLPTADAGTFERQLRALASEEGGPAA
ncbi:MAG: thioredoxin domain-containing protein [Deinococcales bacterium]